MTASWIGEAIAARPSLTPGRIKEGLCLELDVVHGWSVKSWTDPFALGPRAYPQSGEHRAVV